MPEAAPRPPPSSATRACAWTLRSPPTRVERELASAARPARPRPARSPASARARCPPQVVLQRVGREAVLDEAVRRALPDWYEEALDDARHRHRRRPQARPRRPARARARRSTFTIEVGVRPPAKLGDYKGLEVGRREPEVAEEDVDAEVERLRESLASLETVERAGRRAATSWCSTSSARSTASRSRAARARGNLLELGSGRLVPGFEEQLDGRERRRGARGQGHLPGRLPRRAPGRQGRGLRRPPSRRSRRSGCPTLDDDFAIEAGGFDSLDELRADIEPRLREAEERAIEAEFREAVVDAAVGRGEDRRPARARPREGPRDVAPRPRAGSQHQGIDPQRYLQLDRQGRGGARRRGRARGRARAEARGGAGRDRRGRGHRGRATTRSRRAARGRRAERRRAADEKALERSLERAKRAGRATRRCARTSRCARRSTCWSRRAKPIPRRAGAGPRQALDARQGARGAHVRDLDARAPEGAGAPAGIARPAAFAVRGGRRIPPHQQREASL